MTKIPHRGTTCAMYSICALCCTFIIGQYRVLLFDSNFFISSRRWPTCVKFGLKPNAVHSAGSKMVPRARGRDPFDEDRRRHGAVLFRGWKSKNCQGSSISKNTYSTIHCVPNTTKKILLRTN